MADTDDERNDADKAERRAARELIANYHRQELRQLLEHVRDGFARLDAGDIDEFELDELIHRYKKAAAQLWSFCGSSGSRWLQAAKTVSDWRSQVGQPRDWWAEAGSRER